MAVKKLKAISDNLEAKVVDLIPVSDNQKTIVHRRLKKLKRDPKGFIKGMYNKRSIQIRENLPIKYNSDNSFCIVTVVYNSEKYLNDYFLSIINQNIKFEKYIRIICIDDGSTDNSASIIKKWQKKYPNNITYIYKENAGQASARNLGLQFVDSDWVTFVDSDDFLSKGYFHQVDKVISSNKDIKIVCCNPIYFLQDTKEFVDKYPLNYRFKGSENLISCSDLQKNILLSVTASFLHVNSIPKNLYFDECLKPTFEDTKFINLFLLKQENSSLLYFDPESRYFVRDYLEKNLAIDNIWLHKSQFSTVLEKGYLDILLTSYEKLGYVPKYLQRTILWEILKYIRYLLDHEERSQSLTVNEKVYFFHLLEKIFKYIDYETILSFELGKIAFSYKVGMLECFKKVELLQQVAYIDRIDYNKNLFLIRFFSVHEPLTQLVINKKDILPSFYKKTEKLFLGINFITEYRLWYPIIHDASIDFLIDGKISSLTYKGKRYKNRLPKSIFSKKIIRERSSWVFMDRDDRAGDNAEFMYDFVKSNYPNQDIFFVINEISEDWRRLERKGFELIAHGSEEHREVLNHCSLLISSQTNRLIEPFKSIQKNYKIIFLQHGVIKDDMSNWLNRIELDLMITSTLGEYKSISGSDSHYKYGEKEVKLTGLPRFDSLYKNKNNSKNYVFIMFTWRKSIAGSFINNEKSEREINDNFKNTTYFNKINNLLNSTYILSLYEKYGIRFVICPHPNMESYIDCFDLPNYIDIASNEKTIHQLVNETFMLITDYSSISFDFAYQDKPVIYYQFDQNDMYSGNHTYTQGYFDCERDGFGPVVTEELELAIELNKILANNNKPVEPYITRMHDTFAYHDINNCQRVYEAIVDLDQPDTSVTSVDTIINYAQQAISLEAWDLALERVDNALNHVDITQAQIDNITRIKEKVIYTGYQDQPIKLANILWQEKRLSEALEPLKLADSMMITDELLRLRVKLAILNDDFTLARDSQKLLLEGYNDICTIEDWQFYTQLSTI